MIREAPTASAQEEGSGGSEEGSGGSSAGISVTGGEFLVPMWEPCEAASSAHSHS